ncbi:MBL fold metallo-hydrolase [uncultured Oscillibacter sp.]|uniref:MBL fold metallo-hydrolase n=1 Tax=uncultured Oscillibacter sp. TaxID=876091 RepID=UPI002620367E|nr:MBL fold metallo-hydrolase [uncultured Oscillibacter sp.]
MTFTSLASSSHGNCYVVSDDQTAILLECGISFRKIKKGLGFDLSNIRACLVSHEHKDHAKSVMDLIKSGVEVFASEGTAEALDCALITPVEAGAQFRVGSLEIMPFRTWHDVKESLGFLIYSRQDGERLAFATDTVNLGHTFPGVNLLALEANYDKDILARCDRMPDKVKHRVTNSHMEIETLCKYLQSLDLSQCRAVYLLHLSNAASNEGNFANRVRRVVPRHVEVIVCAE